MVLSKLKNAWKTRPSNRVVVEPPPDCPDCGGQVVWRFGCHTYQSNGRWSACLPCDSAIEYECYEDCGWGYDHGLNPGNPRSADNEERRPVWITSPSPHRGSDSIVSAHPGVKAAWEMEDE